MNLLIVILSGLLTVLSLPFAWWSVKNSRKVGEVYLGYKVLLACIVHVLALLVFVDSLLLKLNHASFYSLLRSGSNLPWIVFAAGAVEGIVYEYFGSFGFDLWYYPIIKKTRYYLLVLPIFWGVFMLTMQDAYAIFRNLGASTLVATILITLVPFALIEGINRITWSWVYKGPLKNPFVLAASWLALAYTFVLAYNGYFHNPFGY